MSRISTLAANTLLLNQTLRTQQRVFDGQVAISSEKKSQDYTGIFIDAQRLVNTENTRDLLSRFITNNEQKDVKLEVTETVTEAIRTTISDFRSSLATFSTFETKDAAHVKDIQDQAYRTLLSIQDYLNTDVNGEHLFSGARTTTEPVALNIESVSAFQTKYDGVGTTYPVTRDAHLETFSYTSDTTNATNKHITASNFLQYRKDGDNDSTTTGSSTITASSAMFSNVTAGALFTVANSTNNNGTYTVDSVSSDGRTLTVKTEMFTNESAAAAGVVKYTDPTDPTKDVEILAASLGTLTFDRDNDTMLASTASSLSGLAVGSIFTVSGTTLNDGSYTVKTNDGTTVTIDSVKLTDEGISRTTSGGTVKLDLYTNADVSFDNTTNTIQVRQSGTTTGVKDIFTGLAVGNTFTVVGAPTAGNDQTYTITTISDDGSSVTVAETMTTETDTDGLAFSGSVTYTSGTQIDIVNNGGPADTIQIRDGAGVALAGAFANLSVGDKFSLSGVGAGYDFGNYTVAAKSGDGSQVTVTEDVTGVDTLDITGAHIESFTGGSTFFDMYSNTDISFDNATNTIEVRQAGTTTAVPNIFTGLVVGNTFTVAGAPTAGNDQTYTIATIASDGSSVTVAETMTTETDTDGVTFAGVGDVPLSYRSGTQVTFTNVGAAGTDTIQILDGAGAALAGAFNDLLVGQTFSLGNAGDGYDNTNYTITAKSTDGSTVTVAEDITGVTTTNTTGVHIEAFAVNSTLAASSYYSGDTQTLSHRVSADRSFVNDLTAIDAAFEKTIRALGIILQGEYGSEGGLDRNNERVAQALYLLDSAQERTVTLSVPSGLSTELTGNIEQIQMDLGFNRLLISNTNGIHSDLIGFYDSSIAKMENSDPLETITKLLDDQRSLEASFQTYARIRQLSLTNFI